MTVKNVYGHEVVNVKYLDENLCDLIQEYMPEGWVSENNELFFDDDEMVSQFDDAVEILTRLISKVQGVDYE
jgi:hypothetical protein